MPRTRNEPLELKEACVRAARDVIAEHGIERLSLREVARKLGVSHQAPYKHYASRDHLLAEVMRRCFADFAAQLDARERFDDPRADLASMGTQYLRFAAEHPLEYRLMFGTPWPTPAEHPALVADATHAFDLLRGALQRVHGRGARQRATIDLDALFVWSSMHGLAGMLQSNVMPWLDLAPKVEAGATEHVMKRVEAALVAPRQTP